MVRIEDNRRLIAAGKGHDDGKITRGKTGDNGKYLLIFGKVNFDTIGGGGISPGTRKKDKLLWGRGFRRLCESSPLRSAIFTVLWFEDFRRSTIPQSLRTLAKKLAGNSMSTRIAPTLANR